MSAFERFDRFCGAQVSDKASAMRNGWVNDELSVRHCRQASSGFPGEFDAAAASPDLRSSFGLSFVKSP